MGPAVISVRAFEPSDIGAAAALEAEHQPVPWTEGVFADELGRADRAYLAADADGLIGFGGVLVTGEEAHVTNLLVSPSHRRRGVGRRIMGGLVGLAVDMGARHLTLEVRASNDAALQLYRSLGLAPVGVRPGYYQGEDALIMWAHDIDSPGYLRRLD